MVRGLPLSLLACIAGFVVAGCGGDVGINSWAEVIVSSSRSQDLELVVSPKAEPANSPRACRDLNDKFCLRRFNSDEISYLWQTNSDASAEPFHAYVRNKTDQIQRFSVELIIDGERKFVKSTELLPNETLLVGRVFRNNVQGTF